MSLVQRHASAVRNGATDEVGYGMGWRPRHARVFNGSPHRSILLGLAEYADRYASEFGDPIGTDGVLGDAWLGMLHGFRELLNGELDGMDGGTLWTLTRDLALAAGFTASEADECVSESVH